MLVDRRQMLKLAGGATAGWFGGRAFASSLTEDIIIEAQGDSLTAGFGSHGTGLGQGPYPLQLARLLSARYGRAACVKNRGVGGVNARFCAARANAQPMKFSVLGDSLPPSGPVTLTWFDAQQITNQAPQPLTGMFAGVRGTLAATRFSPTGNPLELTFTRERPGAPQAVAPRSMFLTDLGAQARGHAKLMVYGRNGLSAEEIFAAVDGDVSYQNAPVKRWLVGSVLTSVPEVGTPASKRIQVVNRLLADRYVSHYIDLDAAPTWSEMRALNFSPTVRDRAEIASGVIPTGMRLGGASANQHLNNVGYALWALRFDSQIARLGWYARAGR